MDFLLSIDGLTYNVPALVVLALTIWRRPYLGIVMSGIACLRVWGPILSAVQPISASVHMMLGVAVMGAWRRGQVFENAALFVCGAGLTAFTMMAYGWLLPATASVQTALTSGAKFGGAIAFVQLLYCGIKTLNASQKTPLRPLRHEENGGP